MFVRPRVSPILTRRPSSCCDEEVAKLCSRTSLTMVGDDVDVNHDYGDCDERILVMVVLHVLRQLQMMINDDPLTNSHLYDF